MAYGKHRLAAEVVAYELDEACGTLLHGREGLHVVGPWRVLEVGDVLAGESSPVALAQQRRRDDRLAVRMGYDGAGVLGTLQVARHEYVYMLAAQSGRHLGRLAAAKGSEFARSLSLQYLVRVVHGLAVAY